MKCPKCHQENPETKQFCADCGTRLTPAGSPQASFTKTLETATDELTRGTLFAGRYEIIEELGAGGMGRVYRAYDKKIDEEVALKLIRPEIAAEKRTVERFRNEIKIARKITHKNVCRTHDLGEEGKSLFITMEYVRGEDLKSLIRQTRVLATGTAVSIARQVAEGLGEAHRLGVVHRDLKPHNVMIDKDGNAKIMDFGIARSLAGPGTTAEGAIIGTPDYMAPEQVDGKPADARADIYSLGVVFFEMVTGRLPFEGETPFSIANKHRTEPPPSPTTINPQVPAELSRRILRCLEKDREKRCQTTEEFLADLVAFEESIPAAERTSKSRAATKRKPMTSREITVKLTPRRIIIPAAAFLVLLLAGFLIMKPRNKAGIVPISSDKPSLAVMYFENRSGEKDLDKLLVEMLTTNLSRYEGIEVLSSQRLFDILIQLKKEDSETIDKKTASEVASRAGVKVMLLGSIMKIGEKFIVNSYLTDVKTGTIIASEPAEGTKIDDLYAMVDLLTARLGARLGVSAGAGTDALKSADVRTASLAAYQSFQEGLFDYWRRGFPQAEAHFQKAVDEDAAFASAYLYLALSQSNMGMLFSNPLVDVNSIQKNLAFAKEYADRTTESERLSIDIWTAISEAEFDKARNLSEKMVESFPREKDGYYLLARINVLFDPQPTTIPTAIANLRKLLALDPMDASAYAMMAYASALLKDRNGTASAAKEGISLQPDTGNPYHSAFETHVTLGLFDEALGYADEAMKMVRDFPDAHLWKGTTFLMMGLTDRAREEYRALAERLPALKLSNALNGSLVLLFEGKHAQAGQELRAATEFYRADHQPDGEYAGRIALGKMLAAQGRYVEALAEYSRAEALSGTVDPPGFSARRVITTYLSGVAHARMRDFGAATSRSDALRSLLRDGRYSRIHFDFAHLLRAEILLAQKNWTEAQNALDETMNAVKLFSPHYKILLARLSEVQGDFPKAVEIFKEFYTNRRLANSANGGADRLCFLCERSLVDYHLALIYEKAGDRAQARTYFQRFLDLKKSPDPGIPEVVDAKKRLAALS